MNPATLQSYQRKIKEKNNRPLYGFEKEFDEEFGMLDKFRKMNKKMKKMLMV